MALKIKRVKRSLLDELGDGFDILTDAEATEAGFTLADDEVIAVEKPQAPPPSGETADVADLRVKLHSVNSESAQRRLALKEAKDKIAAIEADNATLKSSVDSFRLNEAKTKATTVFDAIVAEKKFVFASDAAGGDVREEVFRGVDWTKEVTKETLEPLVSKYVEKKPYVLKTVVLGPTEGGRQGSSSGDAIDIDLEEVANAFGLPKPLVQKES